PLNRSRWPSNRCSATAVSTRSFLTCRLNSKIAPPTRITANRKSEPATPRTTQSQVRFFVAMAFLQDRPEGLLQTALKACTTLEGDALRRPTPDRYRSHTDAPPAGNVRRPRSARPPSAQAFRARGWRGRAPTSGLRP